MNLFDQTNAIKVLKRFLKKRKAEYYDGVPTISDSDYDDLKQILNDLEENS